MTKIILGAVIAAILIVGTIATASVAYAKPDSEKFKIEDVVNLLTNSVFGLEEIKTEVAAIESDVADIQTETDKIQMIKNNQYVPFKEFTDFDEEDKLCDSPDGASTAGFRNIVVESDGTSGTIIVTGVVVVMDGLDASHTVQANNYIFDGNGIANAITIDLTGSESNEAGFELLGQPLSSGGNSPFQIAAIEGGNTEMSISLKCNALNTGSDIEFVEAFVSGWKPADSEITVTLS